MAKEIFDRRHAAVTETAGFLAGAVVQPLVCNQGLVSDLCSRESVAKIH